MVRMHGPPTGYYSMNLTASGALRTETGAFEVDAVNDNDADAATIGVTYIN